MTIVHRCPLCKEVIRSIPTKSELIYVSLTDEVCSACEDLLERQVLLLHPPSQIAILVDLEAFKKNFSEVVVPQSHVLAVSLETCQLLLGRLCQDREVS